MITPLHTLAGCCCGPHSIPLWWLHGSSMGNQQHAHHPPDDSVDAQCSNVDAHIGSCEWCCWFLVEVAVVVMVDCGVCVCVCVCVYVFV